MSAAPPKISSASRANQWFVGIVLGAAALGIGATVFFFNPTTHAFYPGCRFHQWTGLNCPGCGATRALYALLHGNFSTAFRDNALFVFGLAALTIRGVWRAQEFLRGRPATGEFFPAKFLWPLGLVAVIFTLLRNLPPFSFLSPA